jgi:PHD/YefM family antitoxin component YafN of YafNO toxin-antitoxin module
MAASFVPCGISYILGGVEEKPIGESEDLVAIADEVEAGRGPVAVVRPGHRPVVLVSAEDWQRIDELESAESTAWWRRDAAERHDVTGEGAHEGEHEPGIDEEEFRRRFAHLFRRTGAA